MADYLGRRPQRYLSVWTDQLLLMGLIDFNPVAWAESAKNAGLERDEIKAAASSAYSFFLNLVWRGAESRIVQWLGLGSGLKDAATALYLTLRDKPFVDLTVPQDMLVAANLSRFQTKEKP